MKLYDEVKFHDFEVRLVKFPLFDVWTGIITNETLEWVNVLMNRFNVLSQDSLWVTFLCNCKWYTWMVSWTYELMQCALSKFSFLNNCNHKLNNWMVCYFMNRCKLQSQTTFCWEVVITNWTHELMQCVSWTEAMCLVKSAFSKQL